VAAVQRRYDGKKKNKKPPQAATDGGQATNLGSQFGQGAKKLEALQLCWRNVKYGGRVWRCTDSGNCQWPENLEAGRQTRPLLRVSRLTGCYFCLID
jgi:hypothetical protein